MILFELRCAKDHVFEAWFRDGVTADKQLAGRKITCPACGNAKVQKAPMAPRIGKAGRQDQSQTTDKPAADDNKPQPGAVMTKEMAERAALLRRELTELRAKVEANCDYVGGRFADEARKIHYGETKPRGIYGESSDHEAQELTEEGIEFARIPWLPQHDS